MIDAMTPELLFAAPETLAAATEVAAPSETAAAAENPTMVPEDHWIGRLQAWAGDFPDALQWLGIILISAIPFVESYLGAPIGVLIGVHPAIAVIAAVVGNMVSLVLVIYVAHWVRTAVLKKRPPTIDLEKSARRQKAKKYFDRFGVPGVSILGPLALPSQVTAPLMVSLGASRNAVMGWMLVSVILWGVGAGLLALGFIALVS